MGTMMMNSIRIGMEVSTLDGKRMGRVKELNSGTFEVEDGLFFKREYAASYDEIARVEGSRVVLDVSDEELRAARRGTLA